MRQLRWALRPAGACAFSFLHLGLSIHPPPPPAPPPALLWALDFLDYHLERDEGHSEPCGSTRESAEPLRNTSQVLLSEACRPWSTELLQARCRQPADWPAPASWASSFKRVHLQMRRELAGRPAACDRAQWQPVISMTWTPRCVCSRRVQKSPA